jgi:hypothetical protein
MKLNSKQVVENIKNNTNQHCVIYMLNKRNSCTNYVGTLTAVSKVQSIYGYTGFFSGSNITFSILLLVL